MIPRFFWQVCCGLMRQTFDLSGRCVSHYVQHKANYFKKHCGGSVILWSCFAALRPKRLVITHSTMRRGWNSVLYQSILKENVRSSVRILLLKHTWVMQEEMIRNTPASPPLTGYKRGLVSVCTRILIQLRHCGMNSPVHSQKPLNWQN